MDKIDCRIVASLQNDGRLSNADLANEVGLSASPCLRRVKLLEERGVITGYTANINRESVGLSLTVFVEVTVARHSRKNAILVEQKLADIPGLVACHMVSGDADFLIELVVSDLKTYEHVLTEYILVIVDIAQVRSNFSLRQICNARPLTLN